MFALALGLLVANVRAGWFSREPPRPGRTTLDAPQVILPAQMVDNYLVVTAKWDRRGPYNFLLDTGASKTIVSPVLAERYGDKSPQAAPVLRDMLVKSAEGEITTLRAVRLRRIELGDAHFEEVDALVRDCTDLSVHLGLRIDGILGFPLFRETLLTLDYPHQRVLLASNRGASALLPGETIPFNNESRTPLILLRVGDRAFTALIDSGNDSALCLNPVGLEVTFAQPPRPGALVATLTGDHQPTVGRLTQTLMLGRFALSQPVVEVTDELTRIGGAMLRHFSVTFDQEHNRVTFYREKTEPIQFPPRRSSGLSFTKVGAYWRVVGVIPGSHAAELKIEIGDLVTRINGEPVERWGPERFGTLVKQSSDIAFTFLVGRREVETRVNVLVLVP
ncbi:MAG: aspartyl protease family protein [Opitutae bacterium]|nr:aspartyl protease family protein [Opitutae bacterium]